MSALKRIIIIFEKKTAVSLIDHEQKNSTKLKIDREIESV